MSSTQILINFPVIYIQTINLKTNKTILNLLLLDALNVQSSLCSKADTTCIPTLCFNTRRLEKVNNIFSIMHSIGSRAILELP